MAIIFCTNFCQVFVKQTDSSHRFRGSRYKSFERSFFRLSSLVENGIKPCIIFDGKPPKLKRKLLGRERLRKIKAEIEWEAAIAAGDTETARTKAQQTTRLDKEMLVESKKLLILLVYLGLTHQVKERHKLLI